MKRTGPNSRGNWFCPNVYFFNDWIVADTNTIYKISNDFVQKIQLIHF